MSLAIYRHLRDTTDLFSFNGSRKLGRERDVGNGHIVEDQVKSQCTFFEVVTYESRDHLTLRDQLTSVELRDDRL